MLGGVGSSEALNLVTSALDDSTLADEAGLAAVRIAENVADGNKDAIRTALEKVTEAAKNQQVIERARSVLKSL